MCVKPVLTIGENGKFPLIQFRVYASPFSDALGKLMKKVNDFQLADPQEIQMNISVPLSTQRNGTLYFSIFFLPSNFDEENPYLKPKWSVHQKVLMSAYREPVRTFSLVKGEVEKPQPPITHLRSIVHIMSLADSPNLWMKELPEIASLFRWQDGVYHPILYIAELLSREKDLVQLEQNRTVANIQIMYHPVSLGKIRFHRMIMSSLGQLLDLGFTQRDIEDVKGIFGDTNLYLLGVTVFVSAIHILFDILSFKNDISFWRSRKSMVGLSTKALLWRCFSYTVIFFYLKDQDTSLLVIIPAGISVIIEFWKLKKALKISFSWRGLKFGVHTAAEKETDAFDNEAMRYLMWLMTPLCIGGAVYSLIYVPHKSWYSWLVESLANGVYAFGFLFMLPQLFVNYKLKSVAHLPWRAFTYKAFNTFIDDLFAFIIVMPTTHRIACFRDDIVFVIYLYQRYLYPVDHSRVNEFGETGDDEMIVRKQIDKIINNDNSEKSKGRKRISKKFD